MAKKRELITSQHLLWTSLTLATALVAIPCVAVSQQNPFDIEGNILRTIDSLLVSVGFVGDELPLNSEAVMLTKVELELRRTPGITVIPQVEMRAQTHMSVVVFNQSPRISANEVAGHVSYIEVEVWRISRLERGGSAKAELWKRRGMVSMATDYPPDGIYGAVIEFVQEFLNAWLAANQ